jgi:aminoglycoside phosphotransferase (APT) family kinase protein
MDPEPIQTLGRGQDHVAYLVDGSLVVRFAQGDDARERVERESRLLALVAELVDVPVPRPAYVAPDLGGLVYERLPGVPLIQIAERERAAEPVGRELGLLLRSLHGVDPDRVLDLVEVDHDSFDAWQQEAASLYHDFAADIPSAFARAIAKFLRSLPPERGSDLVFSHNDLGIEHVLVDPVSLRVTGIIDWSDAALTDPAYDFALLFRDLGPAALSAAVAAYGGDVRVERVRFYAACSLLEDLAYGITTGRDEYVTKSMAALAWVFGRSDA